MVVHTIGHGTRPLEELLGLLTGADIDVVEDLEMVGEELHGRDEHAPMAGPGELRHEVREVGLHPLARLMTGALPAELPPVSREPRRRQA